MSDSCSKRDQCPKCETSDWERGGLFVRGAMWEVAFKSVKGDAFTLKDPVTVRSCNNCGYIELFRKL